jgi:hypothetical protein
MPASDPPPGAPPGHFPTTRSSRVVAAGSFGVPEAHEALAALCAAYWYPIRIRRWDRRLQATGESASLDVVDKTKRPIDRRSDSLYSALMLFAWDARSVNGETIASSRASRRPTRWEPEGRPEIPSRFRLATAEEENPSLTGWLAWIGPVGGHVGR